MAREEHDREDILREATALVERVEIQIRDIPDAVVVGFRRDGSASFYFGGEFVLQFNTHGELRRAYWNQRLVKADRGQLCFMDRQRTDSAVVLRTTNFTRDESLEFIRLVELRLHQLETAISSGEMKILRQVPGDTPILPRVVEWLKARSRNIVIAARPNVG